MPSATTSVTSGSPLVSVPVLSMTTVSMRADASSAVAFLNRTPRLAPRPVPTMIAVGVASPSASGQVITTTVIANSSAVSTRAARPAARRAKVSDAADQRDEHEPERGAVGEPLAGRLGVLRLLDELRRSGRARCRSRPWWPGPAACRCVLIVAPMTSDARCLGHRQALAGDHRLVDLAVAVLDDAVDRDLRAGADERAGRRPRPRRSGPRRARRRAGRAAIGGARSSSARMASLAPPRARISNQWPSSTNVASMVAAS